MQDRYLEALENRLKVAVESQDIKDLLMGSLNYVRGRIINKFPNTFLRKKAEDHYQKAFSDFIPPTIIYELLSEEYKIIHKGSLWRRKSSKKIESIDRLLLTVQNYNQSNIFEILVTDESIYQACQEVTKLTDGRIITPTLKLKI